LVQLYQTTRCYNPEDSHLHTHRRENLKSYRIIPFRHSYCRLPIQTLIKTCLVVSEINKWTIGLDAPIILSFHAQSETNAYQRPKQQRVYMIPLRAEAITLFSTSQDIKTKSVAMCGTVLTCPDVHGLCLYYLINKYIKYLPIFTKLGIQVTPTLLFLSFLDQ
jgi:hypothetical protein